MKNHVTTVEARSHFGDIVNRAAYGKERVVLTRRGQKLAAVIPMEDLELLDRLEDRIDLEAIKEALKDPETIPWDQVKRELGL
jgi:prevent-host-death family protein